MKMQFSAGGVVFQKQGEQNSILVCQHSMHHGWVFPKGLIGDHVEGEKKEDTALRETEEETGVKGKIIQLLNPVDYWYVFEGEKIHKTVYYFLMEYVTGDITKHDTEMEAVEWLPQAEVEKRLTYPSDKKVWQEAKQLLITNI
jgi:8-oxo-dGTP pyrophosphatase MutT (NUDIX family)